MGIVLLSSSWSVGYSGGYARCDGIADRGGTALACIIARHSNAIGSGGLPKEIQHERGGQDCGGWVCHSRAGDIGC